MQLINNDTYYGKGVHEPIRVSDKRRNVAQSPQQIYTYKPQINNPYKSPFLIPVLSTKQVRSLGGTKQTEYGEPRNNRKRKVERKQNNAQLSMQVVSTPINKVIKDVSLSADSTPIIDHRIPSFY